VSVPFDMYSSKLSNTSKLVNEIFPQQCQYITANCHVALCFLYASFCVTLYYGRCFLWVWSGVARVECNRANIVAVVPCITTSLPFPWVCTSHMFLVWLILWLTRTLSRLFSPALLSRICWLPRELDTEGWHSQRERPGRTGYNCL